TRKLMLIAASGASDHYPTGRGLVILGPPLAVKLRERWQWLEWGTVSGVVAGAPFAAFDCRVNHRHLVSIWCRWSEWTRFVRQDRCVHSLRRRLIAIDAKHKKSNS